MTLVACMQKGEVAGLVSDALISARGPNEPPIQGLPAIDGTPLPISLNQNTYSVVELNRKIVQHSPKLVIGFAGPVKPAKQLIEGIEANFKGGESTDDICECLNSMATDATKEVELIGINIEKSVPKVFGFGKYVSHVLGEYTIRAIGSGFKIGIDVASKMNHFNASDNDESVPVDVLCCAYSGNLLLKELESLRSIAELFGGAYEMAAPVEEKGEVVIKTTSDVTHLICFIDERTGAPTVPVIFKQWYQDSSLIVTRICPENVVVNGSARLEKGYRHFVCPSILNSREDLEHTLNSIDYLPDLYSKYINLYGFGKKEHNAVAVNKNSSDFKFEVSSGKPDEKLVTIMIRKTQTDQLMQLLNS